MLSLSAWLAGCTVGPDFQRPEAPVPPSWTPAALSAEASAGSRVVQEPVDAAWWQQFHDPQLAALVLRVEAENPDLQEAEARLVETRYQRDIAAAGFYPTVSASASDTRLRISQNSPFAAVAGGSPSTSAGAQPNAAAGAPLPSGPKPSFAIYQGGFDASWELDLWGRTRRNVEASEAEVQTAEEARAGVLLSLRAEAARTYIELRGMQAQRAVAQHSLDLQRRTVQLTRNLVSSGLAADVDVANAEALAAGTQAQIPPLDAQITAAINRLSRIVGREPGALRGELDAARPVPPAPPKVPVGLPSELARRRPDIRQAEAALHAQTARIGVAVAQLYPSISLTGSLGLQSGNTVNLFNWASRFYSIGPALTIPIFEGGRLRGQVRLEEARQREAALVYRRTVLDALHEVENSLAAYYGDQGRHAALERQVRTAREAAGLARRHFATGLGNFLEVLDAERTRLAAELALAQSAAALDTDLVAAYKSLGGGWDAHL
ncbi:efflux transporter outer membrane subunit [Roseomonas chloroacetimidivorans]|uniref:efflux transporter outer membrane subunit n=1 Tax=Roseomonas chloroacetimidivorans TaxID=1766656 RepID=UPI003C70DB3D